MNLERKLEFFLNSLYKLKDQDGFELNRKNTNWMSKVLHLYQNHLNYIRFLNTIQHQIQKELK